MNSHERAIGVVAREETISLDAPSAWRAALRGVPHAFGHTWESCYAMHLSTGYHTYLYTFELGEIRICCPIAERVFEGHVDVVTPYGFSGFVGNQAYPYFDSHWKQFAKRRGYICGYIGLNPLLCDTTYYEQSEAYAYNQLFALDLTLDLDKLFGRLSTNRRRQVRAAQNTTKFVFDRDRLLGFVLEHYLDFFRSKKASEIYHFSPETLTQLGKSENVILSGVEGEEGIEAVTVLAFTPYVGEYFLNISLPTGQRHAAALLWHGVQQLKAKRVAWFNLGGGIRPDDGVAQFKQRFGGQVFPLLSLKQVYAQDLFKTLCRQAKADPNHLSGYFPPYRAKS